MNREILFRGRTKENEWIDGYYIKVTKPYYKSPIHSSEDSSFNKKIGDYICDNKNTMVEVNPSTIGQYTGLCDKEGKRIFEGDIINRKTKRFNIDDSNYQIIYQDGQWLGKRKNYYDKNEDVLIRLALVMKDEDNEVTILGNIHDNPNLIKEEGR